MALLRREVAEASFKAPAEIRLARKVLGHGATGSEPHRAPEQRALRILFLHDQPDVKTTLGANPPFECTPYCRADAPPSFIRDHEEQADVPVTRFWIVLEKINDGDKRTVPLEADEVFVGRGDCGRARFQQETSALVIGCIAANECEERRALTAEHRDSGVV